VQHQAQVTFFDANERNFKSLHLSLSHSRLVAVEADRLFPAAVGPEPSPAHPACGNEREAASTLPPIYVDSVSLLSNPPPVSLT
jgi:hypothetical protein